LHTLSWLARRRGDRGGGVALSALGYGIATFSAWLGGHLSFANGVGVNQTAFEQIPEDWTAILDETELEEATPTGARANGLMVVLTCLRRPRAIGFARSGVSPRCLPSPQGLSSK
jgi:hypothetical protein